ncbi:hypothetical protein ASG01_14815 [Chryseobacterium sp. Leaf180]|uniref:PAS domain-containing sensor histidine kinase n=1 Tax=Chryseobacterium sp. Leaf180 TaxID=1736289 RepID=UPI0006FCC3A7|nr:PAS domain-containing protein [Chryseobacterium sp. Leaf180]KQR90834.1 hypothetical protein ASG01_14815 [Chryseobacterium sp. Leaf180]
MKQPENALVEALINTDCEGLCILKIDGMMMVQINESFAKLLVSSTDYLKNKSLQDLQNTSLIKQHLISVVDQMHSQLKNQTFKIKPNAKDCCIHLNYTSVNDNNGNPEYLIVRSTETEDIANCGKDSFLSWNRREADNNINQIINMLPASVVVIRTNDLIVEMINDANLNYWKKTREEVIGLPFLEILPDLADQPFASQLRHVIKTGEMIDIKESPVLFTEANGSIRETFVDYTYQPLSDIHGNRNGVLVMSFEITDRVLARKQLEKYAQELAAAYDLQTNLNDALSKSESRFKYVFQEAPVAIGLLRGRDFILESANSRILEVWGKDENIIGMKLADALPEIKDQPFLGLLQNVLETGIPFKANEIQAFLEHKEGLKELFFNVVYQPVRSSSVDVADILVVATDVSEQVYARKQVEKSEAYYKMLADLVPAKISNALPSGKATFFNRRWLEFSGRSFEELQDLGYFEMIHPADRENFKTGLLESARKGESFVSEIRFKNSEGKYIWHLNNASPILDEKRKVVSWIGSTTDIQWLKKEEQRKNDFIGMVSHEMKTPLTSINLYLQMLHTKAQKSDDLFLQKASEQSLKQVKHMTAMINGFLDVSRLESGKMILEKSDFDIQDLIKEAKLDYSLQYTSHQIQYGEIPSVKINADFGKIAQVLNNLVGNAVKYSESGTQITISAEVIADHVRISVKDEGIGIKPENTAKLFDRYYRVKESSDIAGFGIGLYLCSEIIASHYGKIGVERTETKGSTFYFELKTK